MMILEALKNYVPFNEQEQMDKDVMVEFAENNEDAFLRTNLRSHFTASSWIVNKERTKVLLIYHNIYDSWAWTGGHADGDRDLLAVALREAKEETSVENIHPVSEDIFSLEIITVDGHVKRGKYVPSHIHMNVTYLLEADENDILRIKEDENSGVGWFDMKDIASASSEKWMVEKIYTKLQEKLQLQGGNP